MKSHCERCNKFRKMVPYEQRYCGNCQEVIRIMAAKRRKR